MGNEFFGFSQDAFEQFARALCVSVFGPGTIAFGDGPDKGREGIFRGTVPYPHPPTDVWSGYGVIQAKCKAKPEGTDKDQTWALKWLQYELDLFVGSKKRQPKPDYYVFITNVELSAAGQGWDAGDELVESYRTKLPTLKGHAIWGASQLRVYLDTYKELRRSFIAYLTPGDVLAALLTDIERRRPNATRILTTFLERSLRLDESSRLQQAGDQTENQIRLARLFFDLPATPDQELTPPDEPLGPGGKLPPGVLAELLRVGSCKVDPTSTKADGPGLDLRKHTWPRAFLLLGGPGSGKSTVGQFLAQVHRAALLERRARGQFLPATLQHVEDIRRQCEVDDLPWPATPRYPFRVELNRFAKALASDKADHVETLAAYLRAQITRDDDLSHRDLIDWLGAYPWLLILDGLDEVPAASNRQDVMTAINDFLAEAFQAGADLFVVASSRPQSYLGEFANSDLAYRYIRPLSRERSLLYVHRYATARFGADDPRADDVVTTLEHECKNELTAQLMSSPLQATFMATVAAAQGPPSKSRWQLFHSYYRTIYQRELQKKVEPLDVVLRDHPDLIERLHHDIGFLLQLRGETAAQQGVAFSLDEFQQLVHKYVAEAGHDESITFALVRDIVEVAGDRLLLLTSRVKGELTFDVRSLQEYMAAECIMTPGEGGEVGPVKERLRLIAPFGYWRNAFLFGADKCFSHASSRGLVDPIRLLCADLNESTDPLLHLTRAGSELALDILHGASVTNKPEQSRQLARIALGLLSSTDDPQLIARLAAVYREPLAEVYREEVTLRIGHADVERTIPAWGLVSHLRTQGIAWAAELAEQSWPPTPETCPLILRHLLQHEGPAWALEKVSEVIPYLSPSDAFDLCRWVRNKQRTSRILTALSRLDPWRPDIAVDVKFMLGSELVPSISVMINPLDQIWQKMSEHYEAIAQYRWQHSGWLVIPMLCHFLKNPSKSTLADVLRKCADDSMILAEIIGGIPWPLESCFRVAESPESLQSLAEAADRGDLGDSEDWFGAERRWMEAGVTLNDLVSEPPSQLPFGRTIRERGIVISGWSWKAEGDRLSNDLCAACLEEAKKTISPLVRMRLVTLLARVGEKTRFLIRAVPPDTLRTLVEGTEYKFDLSELPFSDPSAKLPDWIDFFDWLGRSSHFWLHVGGPDDEAWLQWATIWESAFSADSTRLGLLQLLSLAVRVGHVPDQISSTILPLDPSVDPAVRLAAIIVRLAQSTLTETEAVELADAVIQLPVMPTETSAAEQVLDMIQTHQARVPTLAQFLIRLHDRLQGRNTQQQTWCVALLRNALQRRPSALHNPGQLGKLQLPIGAPGNDS